MSIMDDQRFERLTEGQKECLRLFHARLEIKDIAREIKRSPVTVNQRLAAARKHIGVDRSSEAARLLIEHERRAHTPSIYEPNIVGEEPLESSPSSPQVGEGQAAFPLPFPTKGRPSNDLSFTTKLAYAALLAALIALIFGGAVEALSGLSELL